MMVKMCGDDDDNDNDNDDVIKMCSDGEDVW